MCTHTYIIIGFALVGLIVLKMGVCLVDNLQIKGLNGTNLCISHQDFINIRAGILHKLVVGVVEDDQCNLAIAEHTELIGLLHEAMLSFQECNLSVTIVGNRLDSDLFATHSMLTKRRGISAIHMSIQ